MNPVHSITIASDIHSKDNAPADYSILISAVHQEFSECDTVDLVICGDLAFGGIKTEYSPFYDAISNLMNKYKDKFKCYLVPGNHDANLSSARNRERWLSTLEKSEFDQDFIETLQEPFESFYEVANRIQEIPWKTTEPLAVVEKEYSSDKKIRYILLNSAITSRIKEQQGQLHLPVAWIEKEICKPFDGVTMCFMHHGPHWIQADQKRKFESLMAGNSDFLITGHEHEHNDVVISTKGKDYNHIECPSYFSEGTERNGMYAIRLNCNDHYVVKNYSWGPDQEIHSELQEKRQIVPKTLAASEHYLRPEVESKLDDIGYQITHPRAPHIRLWDLYSSPRMTVIIDSQRQKDRDFQKSTDFEDVKVLSESIIIRGSESSGKTTLAKRIYKKALENENLPILIDGERIKSIDVTDLCSLINSEARKQYVLDDNYDAIANYSDSLVLIIDDFNHAKLSSENKIKALSTILSTFPRTSVFVDSGFEITEATSGIGSEYLASASRYDIQPWNSSTRSKVVKKWIELGQGAEIEEATLIAKRDHAEKSIDHTLRNGLIPAYPTFVLAILQTLESSRSSDLAISSQGHFYHALLVQSLVQHGCPIEDVDMVYIYLSKLANHLYASKSSQLTEDELNRFDLAHKSAYDLSKAFSKIRTLLLGAKILTQDEDAIFFRYKYSYYFFLAKHLSDTIEDEATKATIKHLCSTLFVHDNANIIVFLTHHSKSQYIVDLVVNTAKQSFPEAPECKLANDLTDVHTLCDELPQLIAPSDDIESNRKEMHELSDSIAPERPADQRKYEFEAEFTSELDMASKMNHAFKNIDIIGQILKNHYGAFTAEIKQEMLTAGVESGFRILGIFYEVVSKNKEYFLEWIDSELKKHPNYSEAEKEKRAKETLFHLCVFFGYGILKRLSYSLGNEKLEKTFERLSSHDTAPSHALLMFSYKLDHLRRFPTTETDKLLDIVSKHPIAYVAAKRMAIEFCSKFKTSFKTRQFIIEKFKLGKPGYMRLLDGMPKGKE